MSKWQYSTPGIPDQLFIRGQVPMTKEEVRCVTISKLRLDENSTVYDIGAGTGSLSIEAALIAKQGQVWAIEREAEGVQLIEENRAQFALDNLEVVAGEAPAALSDLPPVDRVLIGGSGGQLAEILELVEQKLKAQGRIVINAITLETLTSAKEELLRLGYQIEVVTLNVARTREVGAYHMFKAENPIYIISGERSLEDDS
ncbi:precorrin-6Y C5,15-methyltransferase (decarboxylating) subunit CbiT [Fuchsiella alkaliacetigena]|uniref:precorrin-6Y C5,15-methyltransferase (decarboxylating) subunit CbiT n=1 Tax=Fuchsiella alkaliacetigena TaxID=957042 RepID=UPI002009FDAE|nr:precorrin-6Y C5,15-methyltransferase (decarboxylating) subunit CbiT [Fuchsiella alkaliacetigena]MCK8825527.1 precorrin-6Y C5,15-methyltransferase (decarboxylating) subunit CbiT [Fuchsiella alkaliacetigena]